MGLLNRVSEALFSRSSRNFADAMASNTSRESYILGDGTGRFEDLDDKTKFLARKDDASPVESFSLGMNVSLDPWDGCPVVVGWEDGERCIVGMSRTGLKAQGINPNRYNTADTRLHGWTGKSSISDWSVQAIGTLANPSTKFVVQPNAAVSDAYQFKSYVRIQGDVASYIPATGQWRLLMVAVKDDYSLHYAASTTQSMMVGFDESDFNECLAANFPRAVPVVFFALSDDADRLLQTDIYMDGRMLWNVMPPRMNWTATTDPDADDDLGIGYGVGSRWINTTTGTEFVCVDDEEGDAEWVETTVITPTAGSITLTMFAPTTLHVTTTAPTGTDDSGDGYGVGSVWINTTTGRVYTLVDVTLGGAVWAEITNVSTGTVTSVGLSLPAIFNVTGSPVTTSGTLTATLAVQSANTVFAGPTTGSAAAPTFRGLVSTDIPNLDAAKITTGLLSVARGGTGADLSASGGTGYLVKQPTLGGAFTSALMTLADIPNGLITGGKIAEETIPLSKLTPQNPYAVYLFDGDGYPYTEMYPYDTFLGTLGETVAAGDLVVRKDDGKYYKANTTFGSVVMGSKRAIVTGWGPGALTTNTETLLIRRGPFVWPGGGLTDEGELYASTTSGAFTYTEPTPTLDGNTVIIASFGWVYSGQLVMVDCTTPVIYRRLVTAATNAITSITHHTNIPTQSRSLQVRAMVYDQTSLASYASANKDTDIALRGPGTGVTTIDNTGTTAAFLGNSGGTDRRNAQSFSITTNQYLTQFTVRFGANTGTPTGTVTWALQANSGSNPSGVNLVSGTFTPTASADNTITLSTPYPITAGSIYWFVYTTTSAQTSGNAWNLQVNTPGNPYANGRWKADAGTWGTWGSGGAWALGGANDDLRMSFTTVAIDRLAQNFVASSTSKVTSINLWMRKTGSPAGTLTCAIYNVSGGLPTTVITNGTAILRSATDLSTSYGWFTFTFNIPPPTLTNGTQYAIVLTTSDSASSTNYVEWGADQSTPSGSVFMDFYVGSTWYAISPATVACFEVFVRGTGYQEDIALGQWSGGGGQYGVRRGDSSGNNTDTITRFINLDDPMEIYYDVHVP